MSIKALQSSDVQKICNGQVIVDLATAVKELVENALDAGATNIEIKLKEMGFESFEVVDNGLGIDPVNYEAIALKHHTSKIIDFNDLLNVSSFGFRGEALNALCELSGNFSIITKQGSQEIGNSLLFARNGKLFETKPTPRNTGTTVLIENLFESLPVRRSEFSRSIKKHYQKLIKILQSYAVISVGVKIVVMNFTKGVKQVIIGTQGSNSIEDNISSVFGGKFQTSLMTINISVNKETSDDIDATGGDGVVTDKSNVLDVVDNSPFADKVEINRNSCKVECSISGYISKAGVGVGRSDNDRQFIFCNGRPVDLPKVTKVLNEVWRRYEMKQKPACILNIKVPAGTFDVNLTPDKREIVLAHESVLLDSLRDEIDLLYAPSRYTFHVSQGINGKDKAVQSDLLKFQFTNVAQEVKPDKTTKGSTAVCGNEPTEVIEISDSEEIEKNSNSNADNIKWLSNNLDASSSNMSPSKRSKSNSPTVVKNIYHDEKVMSNETHSRDSNKRKLSSKLHNNGEDAEALGTGEPNCGPTMKCRSEGSWKFKSKNIIESYKSASTGVLVTDITNKENDGSDVVPTCRSLEDPLLCRVLNKSDFLKMRVLGQFNLGFIIAQLNGDLYILDQHSCDEKFKFETLRKTTKIHQQPLIIPLKVEVSAAEELVIMDNLPIFEANGFRLNIDMSDAAAPGSRIYLEAIPYSKSTKFGIDDIHELASILSENNDEGLNFVSKLTLTNADLFTNKSKICLPKFISMYASRACRSAVMIGKALTMSEMKTIVNNLATIEQPWNCPHGRPTLRHVLHCDSFMSN